MSEIEIEIEERCTEDDLASKLVALVVAVTVSNLGPAQAAVVLRKVGELIREFNEEDTDEGLN